MAGGDLTARVPGGGLGELGALERAFNAMARQLEEATRQRAELEHARRDLVAAVSHDLRTPLASLRALVEALDDGVVNDPAEVRRYYTLLKGEVERFSVLIDDLFELARLESGALRLDLAPSPVQDLISEALERMAAQADRKGLRLAGEVVGDPPPVLVDSQQFARVLLNLVQNAIRHTPADGSVTVRAVPEGPLVRLEVQDTGEGIPPEELPRVFERFYRGDPARSREAGSGLGLAIARGIVEAHGGRLWVESEPGRGSRFACTLSAMSNER
jgi:signal transduction histidine kinase